ncbi:BREX system serine/threonine kinase PglW [Micromonospora sp. SL1-18]|uniref:BREX system serine/threonine kinase PglW n=1 Tax=Micromonospora sp. SL1-18 TaxID=3399128 RepID=UPI003A4DCDB6
MQEGRWTTITPSQFAHEREALAYVQALLPDTEPYRAWSNFMFTAQTGHPYEVDLLVAAPSGIYLIEIKSLTGRLVSSGSNWIQSNPSGTRTFDNPLHLADGKAKKLKSLLQIAADQRKGPRMRVPFLQAAVFLSKPGLQIGLSDHHLHGIYGSEPVPGHQAGPLPSIGSLLQRPPQDERQRVTKELSAALPDLLKAVGIARSRKHYQIGSWDLESRPFDLGPTWQDHHARHRDLEREHRRVRIYLVERNAVQAERASIERAAKREMVVLHGINHPGIVRVDSMESHEAGPALIFRHDPRAMRLDHYVAQYGERLDPLSRLAMIRQLAEAVAYAHGRRLHHRALSARSVLVAPGPKRPGGSEEEAWLVPQLQISDWQAATRANESVGGSSGDPVTLSSHAASHIELSAEAYLAPELTAPRPDPVAMDVFGLGALAYLILTGQPPAAKRQELLARIARDNGLCPSAVADGITEFADELIQAATAPVPTQRLTTVSEFIEMLEEVENELTAPPPVSVHPEEPEPAETDPLETRGGDRVAEWTVKKRLGTGSTCRAFLAHNERTGRDEVLKVGLSDEKGTRLAHEARVLRPLTDSRVIRLARPEPLQIANRTVIVLEHAGELTLARKLRDDGRLTVDELETYSDYLFGALDYLEGEGVYHRDIKPDNIAIRVRPNRTRQLVLFDFSLAGVSVKELAAGTPRYLDPFLDPFLGTASRQVYDKHAEWYALAVTLHEMASGELPIWGDGGTEPQLTEGPPVLAAEAFDPAVRDGLVEFLHQALHRDHRHRFASLKDMRDAWQQVFRRSDASTPVGTDHPEIEADEPDVEIAEAAREEAAGKATRATALEAAGLTPRAVSASHRLDAATVGELLAVANKLAHLPGLGAKTRQELQRRVKEWRTRLGEREIIPTSAAARKAATAEAATETTAGDGDTDLVRVGLDAIATLLLPVKNSRNAAEVEATRLLLNLPDSSGALPALPLWPQQPQVATAVGVTAGRIAQILGKQRKRWHELPAVGSVRTQTIELLRDGGR